MNPNDLFGNVFAGPWANRNASASQQEALSFQYAQSLASQQRPLDQLFGQAQLRAMEPEDQRQSEIKAKNRANYARWLARIQRAPLSDCEAR